MKTGYIVAVIFLLILVIGCTKPAEQSGDKTVQKEPVQQENELPADNASSTEQLDEALEELDLIE